MRMRVLIVVVCMLLTGGAAWAQPGPGSQDAEWSAWSHWMEAAKTWLSGVWTGVSIELAPTTEAATEDGSVEDTDTTGVQTMDGGSCSDPTQGWQGCAPDPDG